LRGSRSRKIQKRRLTLPVHSDSHRGAARELAVASFGIVAIRDSTKLNCADVINLSQRPMNLSHCWQHHLISGDIKAQCAKILVFIKMPVSFSEGSSYAG
jgi:hypothetical protein